MAMITDVSETLDSNGQVRKVVTIRPEPGSPSPGVDELEQRMAEALCVLVGLPAELDDVVVELE